MNDETQARPLAAAANQAGQPAASASPTGDAGMSPRKAWLTAAEHAYVQRGYGSDAPQLARALITMCSLDDDPRACVERDIASWDCP